MNFIVLCFGLIIGYSEEKKYGGNPLLLILSILGLLLLSAFFSGSETAVMALDRYQIRTLAEEGDSHAQSLLVYLNDPERFFAVVLLGNTFANIAAASLFTMWTLEQFGEVSVFLSTVALTIWVLLFCEFWPKSMAARHALKISMFVIPFIKLVEWLLMPVLVIMRFIMKLLTQKRPDTGRLNAEELRRVIRAVSAQLSVAEQDMLEGVLDLGSLGVNDVMLPKHLVNALDVSRPWGEVLGQIQACTNQYLLVVNEAQWGQVLGVIYLSDVLKKEQGFGMDSLKKIIKEVGYVQEGTALNVQLMNFKKRRQEVSIVVDEYGEKLGMLDVHDIVEEVVGYYANRRAVPIGSVRFDGAKGYWVRADVVVRDLNRYLNWDLPEDKSVTIGGLIVQQLAEIPDGSCSVQFGSYLIEVVQVRNNRLILSHVSQIMHEEQEGDEL